MDAGKGETKILGRNTALLACWTLLAACGGESTDIQSLAPPPSGQVGGSELGKPAPTGSIDLHAIDPLGRALTGANVTVFNAGQSAILATVTTGADGRVLIGPLQGPLKISVLHALGHTMVSGVQVEPSQTRRLDVVVEPNLPVTVALVSASIPASGISADRSEIDLEVRLAASALAPFQANSYATGADTSPYLYLSACSIRVDGSIAAPDCRHDYRAVTSSAYVYQASAPADPGLSPSPYAAMLLLERGPRAAGFDPGNLQWLAAQHFMEGARAGSASRAPDVTTIAGFAGSGSAPDWSPLMLPAPLWTPPWGAAVFQSGTTLQAAAIDSLSTWAVPPASPRAPVIDALRAGFAIARDYAPATHRHAVVALLGGGDDTGRTAAQRKMDQAALRQQQDASGVRTILVAGRLDEYATERGTIADLAASLRAPLIYSGYPTNYTNWDVASPHDGLYAALGLASELLAGDPLPAITVTFRIKSEASTPFATGALLRGTLYVESDQCPMGCWELPLDFAVEIP